MKILIWEAMKGWVNPPSLDTRVAEEMELTHKELRSAQHTIHEQEFVKHMALAKIKALEEWNRIDNPPAESADN